MEHQSDLKDHDMDMGMSEKLFLNRFYVVTLLLIPLIALSDLGVRYLGFPAFSCSSYIQFVISTGIFAFGLIFFKHAYHEIKMKKYGMMTLVSLGVGSGYIFSTLSTFLPSLHSEFYLEISTLIWILLFGHFLEAKSSTAAGDALKEVAKLLPKKAHLKTGDTVKEVEPKDLKEGDVVIVKPGEKVPADGEIIKGEGNFDESHITGESKPVYKNKGMVVTAGSICTDTSVEIKLTNVGESSTIGQIQNLIQKAKHTKPTSQKVADKAAKWLTFVALTISGISFFVWFVIINRPLAFSITLAITVLVIACPHALGLAIPTVTTIATKLAVKNGLFIKDMSKIEIVKDVDYVIFDKTGTLTKGSFGVSSVHSTNTDKETILQIASSIEAHSSHVIGKAIVAYTKSKDIETKSSSDIKNISGKGISGVIDGTRYTLGNLALMKENNFLDSESSKNAEELSEKAQTLVYIANENEIIGIIGLEDEIKPESYDAIKKLHQRGIKVGMLTGDTKEVAQKVANKLEIDSVYAEVLPEEKYSYIKKLQDEGNIVLMAGDGVNDAPALTQADVGVAIGAGTDVAVEAGDVVLTESNPQHIVKLIILSKKVYSKMIQNLWWALGYNIIALPAAAGVFVPLGFRLTPAVGALLMSLSSVIVVINAFQLKNIDY